ncbi:Lrp/AsnC family transcriptional regulator [Rhodoluna lacicola]|jgi:DNA-binding Lrp family transcriptional regulator|uniref:Transcriptional regulators n=1 Tax=Rhodoluna lacicola TaxID=529884 RepID=A0A060JF31_9MICO|nr:Lrp/AsnC family transcriptional regulator [Rhodoluna lacicola]AIC47370.1 Transcriptional regulators [Rhodoluna lacicola]BDS50267.1 AsnC family transcriptional regulator [Rhodoluna lacicola]
MALNNLQTELDEIDHELLRLLSQNARMTNADLAEAAGIAPSTCITRVRSLVSRGVITGFSANINPSSVGLSSQVLISVTLRAGARSHLADFMNEMRSLPEVIQVFFLGGSEDFIVHLAVRDNDHVREFVLENLSSNATVASTRTNMVFEHFNKGPVA